MNRRTQTGPLQAMLLVGAIAAPLMAHDPRSDGSGPNPNGRAWTHVAADLHWHGSFLAARDGQVSIQSDEGPIVTLPIASLADDDQLWVAARQQSIARQQSVAAAVPPTKRPDAARGPWQAATFAPFAPFVSTRSDERWLYVESDGLPHEPLAFTPMVGIRAWQQQVPLPQPYVGANAWQIPLTPELAETPISGRHALMRGAVALAANGIPIFNALNNRGVDSLSIGELDAFGGHCGRGDDYHYHAAPLAIAKVVGKGAPIAFALDGFPIYGLFDPAAKAGEELACPCGSHEPLDELNGHFAATPPGAGQPGALDGTRGYHYHASTAFPYINGGLRGRVTLEGSGPENQVTPQPRAQAVRPALQVLRGASITGFRSTGPKAWELTYAIGEAKGAVAYAVEADGRVAFTYTSVDGDVTKERYEPRREGRGGSPDREPRGGQRGQPGERGGGRRPDGPDRPDRAPPPPSTPGFLLTCSGLDARGLLDRRYTCDGEGLSPPFAWSGLPAGTKRLALTMQHNPPDGGERVYLVLTDIPVETKGLEAGQRTVGRFGLNSIHRAAAYEPPCSKGPGEKEYVVTLFALSAAPALPSGEFTRAELLDAMKGITLGTTSLTLRAERQPAGEPSDQPESEPAREPSKERAPPRPRDPPEGDRGGLLARMTAFKTEVPERAMDVILVRPTERSITVTVGVPTRSRAFVEHWVEGREERSTSAPIEIEGGAVGLIELNGLLPSTAYGYRVGLLPAKGPSDATSADADGDRAPTWGKPGRFRTKVGPGTPFTFVVQADSHLDQGVTPAAYERTLVAMREAGPDFLVDLGDTFMTDKRGQEFERAAPQYDAQRYYFGLACDAAPLFMALGNHDGERGSAGSREGDMGRWSYRMRTTRFPEPLVGAASQGMYSGKTSMTEGRGSHYYAFAWGDAQVIVLDPFWPTTERVRNGGGGGRGGDGGSGRGGEGGRGAGDGPPLAPVDASWASTLGREQYDWLAATLAASTARYRFVFIHHLVGGVGGTESRGGVESAPFFEWGGTNADGTPGFAERRPGWPMPIHELLVKHHVSAVFHGHDHLYVHSVKDGIHYQCVPQPGNLGGNTRSAEHYGYASGTLFGSPGHLRVRVGPDATRVEFVRTALPDAAPDPTPRGDAPRERGGGRRRNGAAATEPDGAVVDGYTIEPAVQPALRSEGISSSIRQGGSPGPRHRPSSRR
jgi:phosphatidylethanolamine-binding protein (PEBP) family uncharacterized protein